jgi:hypothetical protein
MPYVIKKTDGNIVATITDGTIDSSSTSLTLIGKNYKGIGEIYNENLVLLLESFANSTPPNNQIKGQLWFNSNTSKLNVYDGTNWRPVGSPFVSTSLPDNLVQGDLWIDRASQQLKFYDGANLITAGPIYTSSQGKTGWVVEEIISSNGDTRIVAGLYVSNTRMAILNPIEFTPLLAIPGFTLSAEPLMAGFSFNSTIAGNTINAAVYSSQTLVDSVDGELDTSKFLRSDKEGSINGSLTLLGTAGLTVGPFSNLSLFVSNDDSFLSSQFANAKLTLAVQSVTGPQQAIIIDPLLKKVSFYPNDNWASSTPIIDINANATIRGSLTVIGTTSFTNSTTLQISDKNIELAVVEVPTSTTADGAGITVLGGISGNKTITWLEAGIAQTSPLPQLTAWSVNDNLKIPATNSYYIGNNRVLNATSLGPNVTASSLTSVGTLVSLNVASLAITNNTISANTGNNLVLSVENTNVITLQNKVRITNVAEPALIYDVANKEYVDKVKTSLNYLTIDTTGMGFPNTEGVPQVNALIPATSVNVNDTVRVLCLSYANGGSYPVVTRILKIFRCELVSGNRSWVHQAGLDIVL